MKKRLLSLLCVLVLTVSVIPAASALEGEAARAADTLSTLGLIDSTYNLDAPATRAQAAVLLVHLAGGRTGRRGRQLAGRLPGCSRLHRPGGELRRPAGLDHRRHGD